MEKIVERATVLLGRTLDALAGSARAKIEILVWVAFSMAKRAGAMADLDEVIARARATYAENLDNRHALS